MRYLNKEKYTKWRNAVLERDDYKCMWPGCSCKKKLTVHHIKKWADDHYLRYAVGNGITLCRVHHRRIWGQEEQWEHFFMERIKDSNE